MSLHGDHGAAWGVDIHVVLLSSCPKQPQQPQPQQPPVTVSWWRGLVPVRFAPDGEARSRPGVTVAGGCTCTEGYWSKLLHRPGRAVLHHGCRITETAYWLHLSKAKVLPTLGQILALGWRHRLRIFLICVGGLMGSLGGVVWWWRGCGGVVAAGRAGCVCAAFRALLRRGGRCPCCADRRCGCPAFGQGCLARCCARLGFGPDSAVRGVPQLQFSDKVETCPLLRRQVHLVSSCRKLWRYRSCSACRCLLAQFVAGCGRPCDHAETFLVQFLDKVVFMPVAYRQLGSRRAENCAVPQLQFLTGGGRPCGQAATFAKWKCHRFSSSPDSVDIPVVQQICLWRLWRRCMDGRGTGCFRRY